MMFSALTFNLPTACSGSARVRYSRWLLLCGCGLILYLFLCTGTYADAQSTSESGVENASPNPDSAIEQTAEISQEPQTPRELEAFRRALVEGEEAGPYNPALMETYYGMGLQLQRSGQHQAAIDQFNKTMHIERVNQGIYSLAQSPALRGIIASNKALRRLEETTADYYRLLWLHRKSLEPSSSKLIPVLMELNRWHLTAYQLDEGSGRVDHLVSANDLITRALNLAELGENQREIKAQTLRDLLRTTALTHFFLARHQGDDWSSSQGSRFSFSSFEEQDVLPIRTAVLSKAAYSRGRKAHEAIVAMLEHNENSNFAQRVQSYTELGDWHLLFGKHTQAFEAYRKAIALIPQVEQPAALTERLFSRPILLPAVRNEAPGPKKGANRDRTLARIKVDIAANGWGSNVEILSIGGAENKRLTRQSINSVRKARFRPRFVNGDPVASPGEIIDFPLIH